ncbi:glycoside hydrolase [Acephala macrosclerotiorum]|nr:glycoside hydrolase [Acephala macrosclerotiorum]
MNIAGGDFGCAIDGTCPTSSTQLPLSALGGGDGLGQMQHFVSDDKMNIFRFPVSWQFLVNNQLGGTLDSTNFGKYDQLVQACLGTGTYCAIDIHNFARWNNQIIGQSPGVTNDQFTSLWTQLATKYASSTKVIFGLMNEPHDLDVPTRATTVQVAVTAIRNAGASSQMILMPGTNFASAGQFVSSGSADALLAVTNPYGSTTGLIYDLHKYLDVDNSGTHAECTTDNIADAFQIAADYLRTNGRQALVSETGAGSTSSCFTDFCAQNAFLNENSDVFLGYIAWAAGSFATSYVLHPQSQTESSLTTPSRPNA